MGLPISEYPWLMYPPTPEEELERPGPWSRETLNQIAQQPPDNLPTPLTQDIVDQVTRSATGLWTSLLSGPVRDRDLVPPIAPPSRKALWGVDPKTPNIL
mgnify:CR=1 FL=1